MRILKTQSKFLSLNTRSKTLKTRSNWKGYIFILPWLIGFIGYILGPMIVSLYISFTHYDLLSKPAWIGLENYNNMFTQDKLFWKSFKVTLKFVVIAIPLKLIFALFLAILFNMKHKATKFYTVLYYIPSMIGGSVAVAVLWKTMFGFNGPFNSIVSVLGIPKINWVNNPTYALYTIVLLILWQFGAPMIIFLAGLKNIPNQLYEAALVDGANSFQRFFKITIPLLSPVIFFNLVMQIIHGFLTFTQAYLITNGGPLNSTLLYALYLYQQAFSYMRMGYASAMAWFLLIIMAIITGIIFFTSKNWVYYESGGKN